VTSIGIFGGTFDPIHFGHLRIAVECKAKLHLEKLYMLPCAQPAHREKPAATAGQRMTMLNLAIKNTEGLIADDRELKRPGHSYTIDTLKTFQEEFPDANFYLIMGTDAFESICTWHRWQALFESAHIIVARRPVDVDLSTANAFLKNRFVDSLDELDQYNTGKILEIKVSQLEISSSRIRQLIRRRESVEFLLPDEVIRFINQNSLY